jgi:hypothetical protein
MVPLLVANIACQWSDLASLGPDLQELGGFQMGFGASKVGSQVVARRWPMHGATKAQVHVRRR